MKFSERIKNTFSYDYRGLATFRILFGILAIVDLLVRFQDVEAHYSDLGLIPRNLLLTEILHPWSFSLYLLNGTEFFVYFLLSIHMLVAISFTLGFKTKWSSILLYLLTISIHDRCPFINNGGDDIFRVFSFIAMFLPLGQMWSIDGYQRGEKNSTRVITSLWTFAFSLQLGLIYFVSVFHKTDDIWRKDFTAVYYALSLDLFATEFGHWLLNFPVFLQGLTIGTLLVEFFGPIFLFVPWKSHLFRFLSCFLFIGLHTSFIFCMDLGLFAYICLSLWLGALPSFVWDFVEKKSRRLFSFSVIPSPVREAKISVSQSSKWFTRGMALTYIITTLFWNLDTIPWSGFQNPLWSKSITRVFHTYQEWNMFAPFPKKNDGWFVIPAIFSDGSEADLFSGKNEISLLRPKSVPDSFKNEKWRKFYTNIIDDQKQREYFANYLCRQYNELHPVDSRLLKSFKIIYMEEVTELYDPDPPEQMMILWQHFCFSKDREEFLKNAENELPH